MGREPGDLALVLSRLKSANMRHIGVVVTERIETCDFVNLCQRTVRSRPNLRRNAVPAAVHGDEQCVVKPTGEIAGRGMREVVIEELDRRVDIELVLENLRQLLASMFEGRLT